MFLTPSLYLHNVEEALPFYKKALGIKRSFVSGDDTCAGLMKE